MTLINADCLDRETCSAVFFFVQKRNCPGGQPLWGIVLNSEQMGCNPASAFELYPVITVSSAVDAFAICVADVAFVQVVPFAIIRARGSCDNCDIPQKTANSRVLRYSPIQNLYQRSRTCGEERHRQMKNRIVADLDRTEPACKMSDRYAGWGSPFLIFMQLAGWLPALHGQIIMGYR